MTERIHRKIRRARRERELLPAPPLRTPLAFVLIAVIAYLGLAVLVSPPENPGHQFGEGLAVNALSAALLAATAAFAFCTLLLRLESPGSGRWFWLLAGGGFLFLCLDEQLEIHERLGGFLHREVLGATSMFRNWDDVVVLAYGAIGIVLLMLFLPEILRLPYVAELLAVGVVFYAIHSGTDALFPASSIKDVAEESSKVLANTFFALAMMVATVTVDRAERIRNVLREDSRTG